MISTPHDQASEAADGAAFQLMLCGHVDRLVQYVARFIPADLRSLIDAQDVAQDTFFQAARAVGRVSLGDPDSVWKWIASIARNRLSDLVTAARAAKRGGRFKRLAEDELRHGSVIVLLQDLAFHERSPSKSAARREFLVDLERSIGRILPSYRDAIRLRYVEGRSLQETAKALGRSEDATKKHCLRGLQALRVELRSASLYV